MDLCAACGLAQLADDNTVTDEPRGVEPRAMVDQAIDAIDRVSSAGWFEGRRTVREFSSPHGGSWIPLLLDRGLVSAAPDAQASILVDTFSVMHEPDQAAAFATRAQSLAADGVLLLQFHSLATIVRLGQWNSLRHGHFAYYSLGALQNLLSQAGMSVVEAWSFDLYGGSHLIAARHGTGHEPSANVTAILSDESDLGVERAEVVASLQSAADLHATHLHEWLTTQHVLGKRVGAYGAASRAAAVFHRAGVDRGLIEVIADASPAKQGRRMPGTDVPIVAPDDLIRRAPDHVLLMLPDLLSEVSEQFPELAGKWVLDRPNG
jgi:hypothetical protein